jgi:HEPN domain-containing protein
MRSFIAAFFSMLAAMAKPKKTPEELAEDDKRTNPMGLFITAEAYWRSARALEKAKVGIGHSESPIRLLYYHAVELYLKALLRQHYSVATLERKFRHDIRRMVVRAKKHGLIVADDDREIFNLMSKTDVVIRARYIRTGFGTFPTFAALNRTCENLRESVATILRTAGVLVRL